MIRFENPWALLLLLPLAWVVVRPLFRRVAASVRRSSRGPNAATEGASLPERVYGFRYSNLGFLLDAGLAARTWRVVLTPVLLWLVLTCFVLALARPQAGRSQRIRKASGVDIMLVLDVSGSMQALDFEVGGERVDRLTMLKKLAGEFVSRRPADRLGLIVFGANAFSLSPLTLDHDMIQSFLDGLEMGMGGDGTAIGDALGLAVKRLADLPAKSRIAVLLTDGANNAGTLDPRLAARLASEKGVKVYTVTIGGDDPVPIAVPGFFGQKRLVRQKIPVDVELLEYIAKETGAKSYRAVSTDELRAIYAEIDQLEKTDAVVHDRVDYDERFAGFLVSGLFFLVLYAGASCYRGTRRLE